MVYFKIQFEIEILNYSTHNVQKLFFRLLEIVVAIWPALYNGFPLVTSDSGTYISSGIEVHIPIDRPVTYGCFVWLTSMGTNLWAVIFIQAIIFTWLVRQLCRQILGDKAKGNVITVIIIIICFTSSAAWFNSQLMADAFSGMLVISVLLFYLEKQKNIKFLLAAVILFFLLVHTSHIVELLIISIILILWFYRKKQKRLRQEAGKLFLITLSSFLILSSINLVKYHVWGLSPVPHMFIISRMAEDGVLDKFLAEKCPTEHYSLCDYQGALGDRQWDFMWSNPSLPHSAPNGWIKMRKEYSSIIIGTLTSPKYLTLNIIKSIEGTFKQLTQIYVGDGLTPQKEDSPPYRAIDMHFKHQIKEYRSTLQSQGNLPVTTFNTLLVIFTIAFGIAVLFLSGKRETLAKAISKDNWYLIFGITILFLVLNAFITATFSTVIGRLQSRMFWVFSLICLIFVVDRISSIYQIIRHNKLSSPQ